MFADDWIRTTDLWYWKQLLYQLSHNHCPIHPSYIWKYYQTETILNGKLLLIFIITIKILNMIVLGRTVALGYSSNTI